MEIRKIIRKYSLFNRQMKWRRLNYEDRKFAINCTKHIAKENGQQIKKTS